MDAQFSLIPLLFVLFSLLVGALLKLVLRRSAFPYTVGLFCFGLLIGALYRFNLLADAGFLQEAINRTGNINPDSMLYIFLPILIFSAAYELDLHTFRKTFANSTIMAVPGVCLSMGTVALLVMALTLVIPDFSGWNWQYALMFGALISATDPVAVVALLKELKTSKRFSTLVDAESLLNDGTGIVLFMLFFAPFSGTLPLTDSPFTEFLAVAAGGALFGYLMAVISIFLITRFRGDEMVQNSVMILAAYITFYLAQDTLHLSGVIALVAFGLEMTYHGKLHFSPKANEFTEKFWELASFIANTLIFILVGLIIAVQVRITWSGAAVLLILYIGVNIIRTGVVFLFYPVMKRLGYGLTRREAVILSWGGLRGALGLTLALMVSYTLNIPEEIRSQILLMTAGIVTLTLTVNATTIRWLLTKLGLTEIPAEEAFIEYSIKRRVADSAENYYNKLKNREALAGADWEGLKSFLPQIGQEPDISGCSRERLLKTLRMKIYSTEYQLIRQLYADGTISKVTYRKLINSQERHFDSNGSLPLSERSYLFRLFKESLFVRQIRAHKITSRLFSRFLCRRVINLFDIGRGFLNLQRDSLEELSAMRRPDLPEELQREIFPILFDEVQSNIAKMKAALATLSTDYPQYYAQSLTVRAARMMLSNQRHTVQSLLSDGVMLKKDAETIDGQIEKKADLL